MTHWFLILFSLPFIGIGGRQLYETYILLHAKTLSFLPLLIEWIGGVMFTAVGGLFFLIGVFGKDVKPGEPSRLDQHRQTLGILSPQGEWRLGRITSKGKSSMAVGWLKVVPAVVLLAPVFGIGMTRGILGHDPSYAWWNLAAIIPLVLIAKAVYRTLGWRKYGAAVCEVERRPSGSSNEFRCLIREDKAPLPAGDMTVLLRCEKHEFQGTGKSRTMHITPLWSDEKTCVVVPPAQWVDVSFTIPAELPDAQQTMGQGTFWVLRCHMKTPGIDFNAEFNLAFSR